MDYRNEDITDRAKESPLWSDLSHQEGRVLPYMLERYLLLENWRGHALSGEGESIMDARRQDAQYLHTLLAEACTALLGQEERLRRLEARLPPCNEAIADRIADALDDAGFLRGSINFKLEARKEILRTLNDMLKTQV